MDEVDREASTKASEEEGIVNRECVTVESTNGMEYFARFSNHRKVYPSSREALMKCLAKDVVFSPRTINLSDKLNSLNPPLKKINEVHYFETSL